MMYDREFFAWSGARTWCCCPIDFPANITYDRDNCCKIDLDICLRKVRRLLLLLDIVVAMRGREEDSGGGRNVLCCVYVCCIYVYVVYEGKLRTFYPDGGGVLIVSHWSLRPIRWEVYMPTVFWA